MTTQQFHRLMVKRSGDRKSAGGRGGRSGGDGDGGREDDDHFPKIALRVPKCAMEAQQMMGVVVMLATFINFYFQEQIRRASPLHEAFIGVPDGGPDEGPDGGPDLKQRMEEKACNVQRNSKRQIVASSII